MSSEQHVDSPPFDLNHEAAVHVAPETPLATPETSQELSPIEAPAVIQGSGDNLVLVAQNPQAMRDCQMELIKFFEAKIEAIKVIINENEEALAVAIKNKWRSSVHRNTVEREKRRLTYYEKCLAALNAGYVIIPQVPFELFVVRTRQRKPSSTTTTSAGLQRIDQIPAQALAIGEGNYVNPNVQVNYVGDNEKGLALYRGQRIQDIEFPMDVAHPVTMNATERAMSLKFFDQIGVCRDQHATIRTKRDPLIIGRIIDSTAPYQSKGVCFVIASFIRAESLA